MNEIDHPVAAGPMNAAAPWPFPRRVVAVFTSPRALFEHLEFRPTWLVPFVLLLLAAAAYVVFTWDSAWVPMISSGPPRLNSPARAGPEMLCGLTSKKRWARLAAAAETKSAANSGRSM